MARIVHAEDYQTLREIIRDSLKEYYHEMLPAENGADALDLIHCGGIDLLITDWQMPTMNGFELITKLGAEGQTLPVLVLSGLPINDIPTEALAAITKYPGRILYYEKPADAETLQRGISQLLNPADIPEYGIYTNHDNFCMTACEELTKLTKKTTVKAGCLCVYDGQIARTAISHPCDTDKCIDTIRKKAEEHPQTRFYIFALGKPEREKAESQHNVAYVTNGNSKQAFMEIVQRHTDHIPKQMKKL